jgi:predicted transcriptional regulator
MIAATASAKRSALAKAIGLGRKRETAPTATRSRKKTDG